MVIDEEEQQLAQFTFDLQTPTHSSCHGRAFIRVRLLVRRTARIM